METESSIWALGGLGIWVGALAVPLLIYFVVAAFQRSKPRNGPNLELGERLDEPSRSVQKEDEGTREAG